MPEWLQDSFVKNEAVSLTVLAVRLGMAFALGCVVAGVYRLTHGKSNSQSSALLATIVLLTVLIGMVTLVIGNSGPSGMALAFSLVGALSIVRFRTVVEDTRDTAFVIFAVTVGMAVGSGLWTVTLVGIPVVTLAAFLFRRRAADIPPGALHFALKVRISVGHPPDTLLGETFRKHLVRWSLTALATARQGAALDLSYHVYLRGADAAVPLVVALHGLEGVQEVELRQVQS